ncbi:Ubiquitin fusion degradation protein 4 [Tulasnella sp. 331]|nr:Ubiquitin fusion degradation protein 4 [Tulasnella sp. 331]KAG8881994.1 Ubiquitin fusion degradation protein 4 [Tulasnella sp. 332]
MERDLNDITTTYIADTDSTNQSNNQQARAVRSSARVRAVKEKEQQQQEPIAQAAASSSSRRQEASTSSAASKGKQKAILELTRTSKRPAKSSTGPVTASGIVINEPPRDIKGKKRASPEPESESDEQQASPPLKKSRQSVNGASSSTTTYSLRPRKPAPQISSPTTTKPPTMPKKSKSNAKLKSAVVKGKGSASNPGPSGVIHDDGDIEMRSATPDSADECDADRANDEGQENSDEEETSSPVNPAPPIAAPPDAGSTADGAPPSGSAPAAGLGGLDEGAAAALFGSDYRALGSYMMTLSSRLKGILENIKPKADATTRLIALQELSELLSISTEDTLSGYFQIDPFVRELVKIMGGTGNTEDDDGGGDDDQDDQEQDDDAALAAALAMSTGGVMPGDESLEAQMLACRCLANLMEALPGCAHTVVYHGAVPVLCSKLIEIQYIDLAEQTLSTLEKISEEYPSAIVREGGLSALLNYLDFFSTNVQRTALRAAANCCRNAAVDNFQQIKEVFPIIRNVLSYSDQRLVEYACLCVIRVIESFHRSSPDLLDTILDGETIKAINVLLLPAGGSPLVSSGTFTSFLKVLATAAKASPKTMLGLLDADIVSTMYQILTGVLPSNREDHREEGGAPGGQGLGGGLADMDVMQNLAHRPKDQVEEALSLVSELMPPLPKGREPLSLEDQMLATDLHLPPDGVFDHRAYSEKSLSRLVKAKTKADRAAARAASSSSKSQVPIQPAAPAAPMAVATPASGADDSSDGPATTSQNQSAGEDQTDSHSQAASAAGELVDPAGPGASSGSAPVTAMSSRDKEKEKHNLRLSLLKEKSDVVLGFMRSMVPILVDVYAASVATQVRSRSLAGILKAISWLEADELGLVLRNVPIASFVGSVISSKDNPALVIGALQIVEILLSRFPQQYRMAFRREGVLHEIEIRATQELTTKAVLSAKPTGTITPGEPALPVAEGSESAIPAPAPSSEPSVAAVPAPESPAGPITAEPEVLAASPPDSNSAPSQMIMDGLPPASILAAMMPPPIRRSSSTPIDPQDAIVLRCRVIKFKYLMVPIQGQADDPFEAMQALGRRLAHAQANEVGIKRTLGDIAALFTTSKSVGNEPSLTISSFELIKSGLVDEMLEFATAEGRKVDLLTRQKLFLEVFTNQSIHGTETPSSQSGLATLVKRLQESLTRLETYEVVTISQGDDSKRGAAAMLARQLRLRLVAAEGMIVPKNCTNITVSIHAIATFQALHDYLRPRVAGVGPGSRFGGVLAAFAAAAGVSPSALRSSLASSQLAGAGGSSSLPPPPTGLSTKGATGSASGTGSSSAPPVASLPADDGRRRSLRLSKKKSAAALGATGDVAVDPSATSSSSAPVQSQVPEAATTLSALAADLLDEDEDDYVGDDFEAEILEDIDTAPAAERTVSLAIADDGQKVEAQTPDGTRVATPNPAASTSSLPPTKPSYASAVKAKPLDWHLEFSMDDHTLPLEMTIYGAIHHHMQRKGSPTLPMSTLWNGVYTIKFKKVPGPAPAEGTSETAPTERASSPMSTSAPDDAPHAKILRLLRVLRKMNSRGSERLTFDRVIHTLPDSAFVNNKLTAKLTRQLEEPLIVASSCLPDWALDLPQHYGFLFPFATRFSFLQSTSFGYARLILKWQSQQTRTTDNHSRRDEAFNYLGRLQRQKVRIARKFLLESAIKVLELYGSSASVLEVEYFDEVGTGLGPTLEFYSLVSKEFARKNLKIWHDADASGDSLYVSHPMGLFPAPLSRKEISDPASVSGKKRADLLKVLGQFVAKALLDSRIIDISMSKIFLKFILGEDVPLTIASLKLVDAQLANSLSKMQAFVDVKRDIEANVTMSAATRRAALSKIDVDGVKLDDLSLDFTLPGYDIELRDGGKDIPVDASNVEEYIKEVLEAFMGRGVQFQAQAFREGFSKVFPVTDLHTFSSDELSMMFGNEEEDWSAETLSEVIKADHGFHIESRAIKDLLDVMVSYDTSMRRQFLQFITGSPRLPVGGFRGLNPPLTVVRKPHEAPLSANDYLPSVMTCVNYLKLPEYTSRDVMAAKLEVAIKEGVGSFHLS